MALTRTNIIKSKDIVKYNNRKFYDLEGSYYVNLTHIVDKIKLDPTVRVIEKPSYSTPDKWKDITQKVLASYIHQRLRAAKTSESFMLNLVEQIG